jgi:PAP2 superfamily
MRVLAAALLSLTSMACATVKLAGRDVVEVAKAPAREWKSVAAATAVAGAAVLLDDEIAQLARRNNESTFDSLAARIEPFGGGHSDKVMAGFLLYGYLARDDRAGQVAFDSFVSSMIASKAITPAIKQLAPRTRPHGGGDDESFPSNHATQAFAVASVIASHYPERRWVRWLSYGVAGGVGLSRIYHDDHYASDVVAGAAIGMLVGKTVVRTNEQARATWTVSPIRNGAVVSVSW